MTIHSFPALGFDPAPGEPADIAEVGRACTAFAAELHDDARRATALQSGYVWNGKAAEAFEDRLRHVPRDLDRAADAQAQAGAALATYSALLASHQTTAREYEREAQEQIRIAHDATEPTHQAALEALTALRCKASTLRSVVQIDAQQCTSALLDATRDAPKPPGWFSSALGAVGDFVKRVNSEIGDFVRHHAGFLAGLAAICSQISSALALVAMVVGPIPVLGEAVGTVAFAGALLTGGIALAGHALLATYAGGSWGAVGFDAVALASTYLGGRGVTALSGKVCAGHGWELGAEESMTVRTALSTLRAPGKALDEGATATMTFPRLVTRTIAFQFDGTAGALGTYDLAANRVSGEIREAQEHSELVQEHQRESSLSTSSDLGYELATAGAPR